ncbi:MAG: OmpH family outer membrane protein [Parachlamydiaceae bacterium]
MKKLSTWFFSIGTCSVLMSNTMVNGEPASYSTGNSHISQQQTFSGTGQQSTTLRIGIVNTKKCLEESKLGKQEQANFEKMKQQMESVLQEKERVLEEIDAKVNDDDYMDSISEEAASELKRKKRTIKNEGMQLQSQYMQTLQQANLKIIQRLTDVIGRACGQVAKDKSNGQPVDVIFTDEACTFYAPGLDVSDRVIIQMNMIFDAEQKEGQSKLR